MVEKFHILGQSRRRVERPATDTPKRRKGEPRSQCGVCQHPDRLRIEMLLANGGASYRGIAKEFGVNFNTVGIHLRRHMTPDRLARLRLGNPLENNEVLADLAAKSGISALENLRAIHAGVVSRWLNALESQSDGNFIALTSQARQNIELLAKLSKELQPAQTNVNIGLQANIGAFERPEYVDAIATIVAVLRKYPEARLEVAEALRSLEIAQGGAKLIEGKATRI